MRRTRKTTERHTSPGGTRSAKRVKVLSLNDTSFETPGEGNEGKSRGGRTPKYVDYVEISSDDDDDDGSDGGRSTEYHSDSEMSTSEERDYTDVEALLTSRESADDREKRAILVKWAGQSYLHTTWEWDAHVRRFAEGDTKLKNKVKKLDEELRRRRKQGEAESFEIDSSLITVDRVLDTKDYKKTEETRYFVKWKGLPYTEATWETEESLRRETPDEVQDENFVQCLDFESALGAYQSRKPVYTLAKEIVGKSRDPFQVCRFGEALKRLKKKKGRPAKKPAVSAEAVEDDLQGEGSSFKKYESTPDFLSKEGELYTYQLEGLNWLEFSWQTGKNVILGDEMGLGKTVQAISLIASLHSRGCARPHLIVVPLSTLLNWEREFQKWAPHLNVINYSGNAAERQVIYRHEILVSAKGKAIHERIKAHVMLTTYEMVLADASQLGRLSYGSLIIDEGHRLKNRSSKLFGALKRITVEQRIILSGTPLQNNLEELFMLMHFLDPTKFTDAKVKEFLETYGDIGKKEQIEELHRLLAPHLLRRMKQDVLKHLPPKKEQIVLVEMSHEQKDVYKALLTENYQLLSSKSRSKVSGLKNLLMDLRKCCLHPSLITKNFNTLSKRRIETFTKRSGKLHLLERMLEKLVKGGHRVLIYSQFSTVLDMVEEWLAIKGIKTLLLDGSIRGKDRQKAVDAFNSNENGQYSVFLLSTKAGGLGINLATADTVIIFDSDWNPHNDIQAQARAHRLGQSKEVMIYRLVTRATVEERIVEVAKRKLVLEHLVVSKGAGREVNLKQEEIDDVIRYGVEELFHNETEQSPIESKEEAGPSAGAGAGRTNTAQREIGAGREGGHKGKGVYYDDAALDKILDRKLAWLKEEEKQETHAALQAFKVANFEIQEGNFWEDVLQETHQEAAASQMEELGKGKREKKKLDADVLNIINSPDKKRGKGSPLADLDYDLSSSESSESESEGEDEDFVAAKNANAAAAAAAAPVQAPGKAKAKKEPKPRSPPREIDQEGNKIFGFKKSARKQFYNTFMRFGIQDKLKEGENRFSALWRKSGLDQSKTLEEFEAYGNKFLELALEGEDKDRDAQQVWIRDEMNVEDHGNAILQRIADLQLLRDVVEGYDRAKEKDAVVPERVSGFLESSDFKHASHLMDWSMDNDVSLFQAVLKWGWGQWKNISTDESLGLTQALDSIVPDPLKTGKQTTWITNRVKKHVKKMRKMYEQKTKMRQRQREREERERKEKERAAVMAAAAAVKSDKENLKNLPDTILARSWRPPIQAQTFPAFTGLAPAPTFTNPFPAPFSMPAPAQTGFPLTGGDLNGFISQINTTMQQQQSAYAGAVMGMAGGSSYAANLLQQNMQRIHQKIVEGSMIFNNNNNNNGSM